MKKGMAIIACALVLLSALAFAANNTRGASPARGSDAAAPVPDCTDSDGGFNSGVRGSATGCYTNSMGETACGTYSDKCISGEYAQEAMCKGGKVALGDYFCDKGLICNAGACVSPEKAAASKSCVDLDNGTNLSLKATTTGCHYWNPEKGLVCDTYVDTCDQWTNSVLKYSCQYGDVTWNGYSCPEKTVCSDGKCVACTETDMGAYIYGSGITGGVFKSTNKHQQKGDYCMNGTTVHEYYCKDGYVEEANLPCNSGYSCIDGECVQTGATCASEGQSCQGAVCCKDLSCTKVNNSFVCKQSLTAQAVEVVKELTGTAKKQQESSATGTIGKLGPLPPDSMYGYVKMGEVQGIFLTKHNSLEGKYYLALTVAKGGESYAEGVLNGFSQKTGVKSVTFVYGNPQEAIAMYGEILKLKKDSWIGFVSEDCTYDLGAVDCHAGEGTVDVIQLIYMGM